MNVKISEDWKNLLQKEFESTYFQMLTHFVKNEYKNYTCYPKGKNIFVAFDACPFEYLKVVIIGQDPYHGVGQANGLCFSVGQGVIPPPSLQNIFLELQKDVGISPPQNGDLLPWAKQGVLLLNATLTVRAHQAGSHQNKGWEQFTDAVIDRISYNKERVVFLLWGSYAKTKGKKIDSKKHLVLESGHPSPLSANRGYWFGNKHFSKTNEYLIAHKKTPIDWAL